MALLAASTAVALVTSCSEPTVGDTVTADNGQTFDLTPPEQKGADRDREGGLDRRAGSGTDP